MDKANEILRKSAAIEKSAISDADLAAINKFALKALSADEVFSFTVILCGNAVDRTFDRFTDSALEDMKELYVGKTVIKDHAHRADGQIARIYATELTEPDENGYRQLKAKCYMVRTEKNADLIREIEGGIKREGSVSFTPKSYVCGICGADNLQTICRHWPGMTYKKDGEDTVCVFTIGGVSDCYEFSLVAVPAQPEAGVCKAYKGQIAKLEHPNDDDAAAADGLKASECESIRRRLAAARIRAAKNKKEIN